MVTSWVSSNNHSSFLYVSLGWVRLMIAPQGKKIGPAGLEPHTGARNRREKQPPYVIFFIKGGVEWASS